MQNGKKIPESPDESLRWHLCCKLRTKPCCLHLTNRCGFILGACAKKQLPIKVVRNHCQLYSTLLIPVRKNVYKTPSSFKFGGYFEDIKQKSLFSL